MYFAVTADESIKATNSVTDGIPVTEFVTGTVALHLVSLEFRPMANCLGYFESRKPFGFWDCHLHVSSHLFSSGSSGTISFTNDIL